MRQFAVGVLVHESDFLQSNAVVVAGATGALVVDAGIRADELVELARSLEQPVSAGFSTHPHWDHLLWHADLGDAPRYGTARAATMIAARLADENWRASVAPMIPQDIVDEVPLDDTFGRIIGLPEGVTLVPWDGPEVRIVEHSAHAPGHAALLIPSRGVLIAGDMLSDLLVPILNPFSPDPVGEYLAALTVIEDASADVDVVIPGHGSVGDADVLRARIAADRSYLEALRDGRDPDDPRLDPAATYGSTSAGIHERQAEHVADR